jgi:type I restriction enzyme M protein
MVATVEIIERAMTEDQKKKLEQKLWNIADELRGKMNADEFRDYCLGFIFYKYLSERLQNFANKILKEDDINFRDIDEKSDEGRGMLEAIAEEAVEELGYFLKPSELFSNRPAWCPPERRGHGNCRQFHPGGFNASAQ